MFSPFNFRLIIFPAILFFTSFFFDMSIGIAMEEDATVAASRRAVLVLAKNEIKEIRRITGYEFQNLDLLQTAFVHSSLSGRDTTFERLESLGDGLIKGIVTASLDFSKLSSEAAMHDDGKAKIENAYFAARYEVLGLSRFLKANPDALSSPAVTGKPYKKAYADGLEALVGAIKLDWEAKYPHLCRTGRVFTILTPIVSKMLLLETADPSVKPITAVKPTKAPITVAASKPKVSAKAVRVKAALTSSVAAAKPKKPKALVTVSGADGRVVITKQAKGENELAARTNAIRIPGFWESLDLPACKAKKRKWENFVLECQKKGYTVMAEAS